MYVEQKDDYDSKLYLEEEPSFCITAYGSLNFESDFILNWTVRLSLLSDDLT